MADAPIVELVVSPRWIVSVGAIDHWPHVILRIQHPRLGPLDFLLPDNDAIEMAAALEKTWERRDAARMRHADGVGIENNSPATPIRASVPPFDDKDEDG